jgi:hypothetical protein
VKIIQVSPIKFDAFKLETASTVVEHSPHIPKVEGLSLATPAAANGLEKMAKSNLSYHDLNISNILSEVRPVFSTTINFVFLPQRAVSVSTVVEH